MLELNYMKPFYSKIMGDNIRLTFAYQYFSIKKDDEVFHFIPLEGKEIILNLHTLELQNDREVFVFQRGNRFMRMTTKEILKVDGVINRLTEILSGSDIERSKQNFKEHKQQKQMKKDNEIREKQKEYLEEIFKAPELHYIEIMINKALDEKNEEDFRYYSRIYNQKIKKNEVMRC